LTLGAQRQLVAEIRSKLLTASNPVRDRWWVIAPIFVSLLAAVAGALAFFRLPGSEFDVLSRIIGAAAMAFSAVALRGSSGPRRAGATVGLTLGLAVLVSPEIFLLVFSFLIAAARG
jgi:hypothetical protein